MSHGRGVGDGTVDKVVEMDVVDTLQGIKKEKIKNNKQKKTSQ
jgi:hypothetical protein